MGVSTMLVTNFNFTVAIFIAMIGLYIIVGQGNLIKKLLGLNLFQSSVFLLYISMGKISGERHLFILKVTHPFPIPCLMF